MDSSEQSPVASRMVGKSDFSSPHPSESQPRYHKPTHSPVIYLFQKFISSSDLESHPQSRRAKAYNPSKPLMTRRDIKTKGHVPAGRGRGSCRVEGRYLAWTICSHSGRPLKDFYPHHESRKEVGRPAAGIFSTPKLICQYLCIMYSNFFSVIATTGG